MQAAQHGWTPPVFADRRALRPQLRGAHPPPDRRASRRSAPRSPRTTCARSPHAAAYADPGRRRRRVPGPARPGRRTQAALLAAGRRVRCYCPIGDLVAGMAYLVRRLLENTSNDCFLRAQAEGVDLVSCWRPHDTTRSPTSRCSSCAARPSRAGRERARRPRRPAAARGADADRRELVRGEAFASVDPSAPKRVVAHAHAATARARRGAVGRAGAAARWSRRPPSSAPPRSRRAAGCCATAGSSSPRWPCARPASRGPRPTPTSARPSTSWSTTPPAPLALDARPRADPLPGERNRCTTSRAASPA